jgi:uncharacterized cupin superfamily protein
MSETAKTLVFVVLGAIALAVAWIARPATIDRTLVQDAGQRFFDEFDPLDARSLEIISLNPDDSTQRAFKVAQLNGRWSIPSREDYPADAQDHLASAATSVMDLIRGPSVSDSPADHALYGVLDPTDKTTTPTGAGTRVTLKNETDKTLVDLIIGKAVKNADQLRYVREPGRDRVYTVEVDPANLTTKFEDWIERDLLKFEPVQLKEVFIDDYSIDELQGRIMRGEQLALKYDSAASNWTLDGLAADETLDTAQLDELRTALDDLNIVDVHRKPQGLSTQLQGESALNLDQAAADSLQSRGYFIVRNQLLSDEGETFLRMNDGVEYSLRFGSAVQFDDGSPIDGDPESLADNSPASGRYVFVTARFDSALIPPPELEDVPEASAPASQPDSEAAPSAEDAARAAIIASNERKQNEYDEKVAAGQERVRELNKRFADWYFVVSDDTYQKIRLRRKNIVSRPEAPATQPLSPANPIPMSVPPPTPES